MGDVVPFPRDVEQAKRTRLLRELANVPRRLGVDPGEWLKAWSAAPVRFLATERATWRFLGVL